MYSTVHSLSNFKTSERAHVDVAFFQSNVRFARVPADHPALSGDNVSFCQLYLECIVRTITTLTGGAVASVVACGCHCRTAGDRELTLDLASCCA